MSTNKQRERWTRIEKLQLMGVMVSIVYIFVIVISLFHPPDGPQPNGDGRQNNTISCSNSTDVILPPPPPPDTTQVRVNIAVLRAIHPVTIFLDDEKVGQTPCKVRIAKDSHRLVLRYTDKIKREYEFSSIIDVERDTCLTYDVHNFLMK